jgi:NitT/TauT family transport system substrate-binding protein
MIAEHSDLVQRFVNAYAKAFADVVKNPDEAVDLTIKENPEYAQKKDVLSAQLKADLDHTFFSPDTKAHGVGWMTEDIWRKTIKILVDQNAMKQSIEAAKAFNNQYVGAANTLKQ